MPPPLPTLRYDVKPNKSLPIQISFNDDGPKGQSYVQPSTGGAANTRRAADQRRLSARRRRDGSSDADVNTNRAAPTDVGPSRYGEVAVAASRSALRNSATGRSGK
jgi:hypothetical protein